MITSAQNAKIKAARLLAGRPKERREAGAFLAEGVRLVEDALQAGWPFRFVLYSDDVSARGLEVVRRLEGGGVSVEKVNSRLLARLSDTETPQGILAVLEIRPLRLPDSADFVLILDSIRDPGNLGTLLRTAEAAGVQAVLLAPDTTDALAPKVVRAGMGAHFRLPIWSMGWDEIARCARSWGLTVHLAEMGGQPCWEADLRAAIGLIIGGEAQGASDEARRLASRSTAIPMQGRTESLNAAVAGALLMYEVMRQRRGRVAGHG